MDGVLATMLDGVIDYAGLFPPAKLSMAESVEHYLRYVKGDEKWIVSRFVCSSGRLDELARELQQHPDEPFVPVTVVGQASADHKHWGAGLEHDAQAMTKFIADVEEHAEIEAFEVRIPDHEHVPEYLNDLKAFQDAYVYVELPWDGPLADTLTLIAETEWLGAKARTGGIEVAAFPPPDRLASFLQQCTQLDIEFKLTAGLHHPIRRFDEGVGTKMHGFLNVGTALSLMHAHELSVREIETILSDEDQAAFHFGLSRMRWRDMEARLDDVEAARELFVGFGSCSVREPLDDLEAMGLLKEKVR
jgi:hypothetical protein